jgi:GNAT superfamily N-acetyltransferase
MDYREILSCLDRERQTVPDADIVLERTRNVVRGIAKLGTRNGIVYSNFSLLDTDKIIESEIDYFTKLNRSFEWKVYSHDEPADLLEHLRQRGFKIGPEEALMILELGEIPPVLLAPFPDGITVRPVTGEPEIEDFLQLETEMWGAALTTREFLRSNQGDSLRRNQPFIAYMNDRPVGMARVTAPAQTELAGLWGGCVLSEFRGRGVYRALLAARIQRAQEFASIRYLRVDALPTSRPILEKYGFSRVGSTWPAIWPLTEDGDQGRERHKEEARGTA